MNGDFLQQLESYLKAPAGLAEIARAACQVLKNSQPQLPFVVVQYQRSASPLSVFFQNHLQIPDLQKFASLQQIYQGLSDSFSQVHIPEQLDSSPSFILILPGQDLQKEAVKHFVRDWRIVHRMINNHADHLVAEQNLEYGNQISQLIHDIDALMRLWQDPEKEPQKIEKRLKYQEKLNQRLLFFVRDLEILKAEVNIRELIHATLDEPAFRILREKVEYSGITETDTIEVDLELFNMAVKEALMNAFKASRQDAGKIRVKISKARVDLHFFLKEWLIVTIINEGSGINPDFLPWVRTPYFTTWKEDGHPGFGLAISQKIVEAHQGFLDVQSSRDGRTKVSLYWPMKDHD